MTTNWTLKIETSKKIIFIKNPRKVVMKDFFITSVIKVMDDTGKWHNIGHSIAATKAVIIIDRAIKYQRGYINLKKYL